MPTPPEPTALYRLYNADDRLLYIGISREPEARLRDHRWAPHHGKWAKLIERREITWHSSRAAALTAEAAAIREERPAHNGSHNYPHAPFNPAHWPRIAAARGMSAQLALLVLAEIESGRWQPGMKLPSCSELGRATGMSKSAATSAIRKLCAENQLTQIQGVGVFVYSETGIERANQARRRPAT
ncbi:GntR family transcriptional regulator [Streptomyces rubiginosohelvolus]|uniref:GntR family transcriptional regulator n=1 Tax=Streptomyces rubiginosohelvolus TaxID=67362 RepID=UPI0037B92196